MTDRFSTDQNEGVDEGTVSGVFGGGDELGYRTDEDARDAERAQEIDLRVTEGKADEIDDDDMRAADGLTLSESVAEHAKDLYSLGAATKGEGKIP